jgi:O-antigen/teichoic acid export membrane protein
MTGSVRQIGRLMGLRGVAMGLTFVQTVVLTRAFGTETFGLLSFAISVSALLLLVLSFGLDQVLMRSIAQKGLAVARAGAPWRTLWRLIALIVAPAAAVAAVGVMSLAQFTTFTGPYWITLFWVFLVFPALMARKYIEAVILGCKDAGRSIIGSQIAFPAVMVLGGLCVWVLAAAPTAAQAGIVYAVAVVLSLGVCLAVARMYLAPARPAGLPEADGETCRAPGSRALLVSGAYLASISLGLVLSQHVDVLLMGVFAGSEEAALVRVASRVAEAVGIFGAIILLQYKPVFIESHGRGDLPHLQKQARALVTLVLVTGLPLAVVTLVFADRVMLVFGAEFVQGTAAMRVYVAGIVMAMLFGAGNVILALCGHERTASRLLLVALVFQIALNLILIPRYGIMGCAAANFCALTVQAIASRHYAKRLLGVETGFWVVFRASGPAAPPVAHAVTGPDR